MKKIPNQLSNQSTGENLRVLIRIRPPLPREIDEGLPFRAIAMVPKGSTNPQIISLFEYLGCEYDEAARQREWVECPHYFEEHRFTFDRIFDMSSTQEEVYKEAALPAVESILQGYNSTILAYGQTGTGKTFTMEGFTYDYNDPLRGIVPRVIEHIFNYIETNDNKNSTFIIRATYLQIYNENISDLLRPENQNLLIRESKKRGLYVQNLSEWAVRAPNDIYALLKRGESCRAKASTNLNDLSSRSHAVFTITVESLIQNSNLSKSIKIGKLNLVDLAGSERIKITGAKGKQLEESKSINKSLSALGNVIYALTEPKGRSHIPYRDSKLTRLLENSLGGNCKTTMISTISPAQCSFNESLSTLNFSKRAKSLKSNAKINEDIDHNALIRKYEEELIKLRNELEEKNKLLNNNQYLLELQKEKEKVEKDRNEVVIALEEASKSFLKERDEKKKLEEKIQIMNYQLIQGGEKINFQEMPEFQTLLKKQLIQFEKNFREENQKEKSKMSSQQIDIMNSLTIKLNERDEKIAQLEEKSETLELSLQDKNNIINQLINKCQTYETLLIKNNIQFDNFKFNKNTYDDRISELNHIINQKNNQINQYKQQLELYTLNSNSNININTNKSINIKDFYNPNIVNNPILQPTENSIKNIIVENYKK